MNGEERIFNKLDEVHKDVNDTKVDVGVIKTEVKNHGEAIERHGRNIEELYNSRDKHALKINTINTADNVVAKHKEGKTKRMRWLLGILITAVIAFFSLLFGGIL